MLSDFGNREPAAGIMRAVILGICRDAVVVDLTHDVDKYAVRDGALHLWCAVPYLPIGAHLAVVDPGVGTVRQGIALQTSRGDYLVGPDNGLLMPAAARLGGITKAHLLESPGHQLSPVSSSFHGRDVFAPATAHLAGGVPIEDLGRAVDPRGLVELEWPAPMIRPGSLLSHAIFVDSFGNVKLSALAADVQAALPSLRHGEPVAIELGPWPREGGSAGHVVAVTWADTFGSVPRGTPLLYTDSYGRACLAVNQGSAASVLGIRQDQELSLTRPARPARAATAPSREPPAR